MKEIRNIQIQTYKKVGKFTSVCTEEVVFHTQKNSY